MAKRVCYGCDYWVDEWVMVWDIEYGGYAVCVECKDKYLLA